MNESYAKVISVPKETVYIYREFYAYNLPVTRLSQYYAVSLTRHVHTVSKFVNILPTFQRNPNKKKERRNKMKPYIQNDEERSEDGRENKAVEYDELLISAGEFGRYQIFLFFLTFPFNVYAVFVYFTQMFMTEVSPNHWCWIPELENMTEIERRSIAVPPDHFGRFGYSQCESYVANWSEVLATGQKPNETWDTQPCRFGWEFNKTEIPYPTISSELGWVCDKDSYQATAQAIFFMGSIVGGTIIGWVADRYGRLPAASLSNVIGCIAGIVSIFAQNMVQFSICRFMMGMSYDNCLMMVYLLVLEYVAPKYRSIFANLPFALFYTLSATILPYIALAVGHWKTLSLVTSIPMIIGVLAPFYIPESPRWLLSRGRIDEALSKVINIGKVNKKTVPLELINQFKLSIANKPKDKEGNTGILEIFRRPVLRKVFICISVVYICSVIVFDALIRSIGGLNFDYFLSFSIMSFTELPSQLLVSLILDFTGRKWTSIISFLISALFCFMATLVNIGISSVVFVSIAKFAANISYSISIQWVTELLPTPVRGSGAAMIHIFSFFAIIISPYIILLEKIWPGLTSTVLGLFSVVAVLFALTLPETTGKDMPQTFDDAEYLTKNQIFFDIPFLRKKDEMKNGNINPSFEMN